MPPPIMTETNIANAIEPGSKYFMYSIYGYSSTIWSTVCCNIRGWIVGLFSEVTMSDISLSIVEVMKLSLLSTIRPIFGWSFSYTRREYCGGMMTAPWI